MEQHIFYCQPSGTCLMCAMGEICTTPSSNDMGSYSCRYKWECRD